MNIDLNFFMNFLSAIEGLLGSIPPTFWATLIGALFVLVGVIVTNRANDRRLEKQLAHDRDAHNRERQMSLRRDVYLAAAEAISAGLYTTGQYINLEIPYEKITEAYQAKAPSIAKVQVIAKEETIEALVAFSNELTATFLRLAAHRMPLMQQKQRADFLQTQVNKALGEQTAILEEMKHYNREGISDQQKWELLNRSFGSVNRHLDQLIQEQRAQGLTFYSSYTKFVEKWAEALAVLSQLLVPVVLAARKELELPIDETEYRRIAAKGLTDQMESLRDYMSQLQRFVSGELLGPPPPPTDSQ